MMEIGEVLTTVLAEQGWIGVGIIFVALLIWFRVWPWWSAERTKTLEHERRLSEVSMKHDEAQTTAYASMAVESKQQSETLTRLLDVMSVILDNIHEQKAIARLNGEGQDQIYAQLLAMQADRCTPEKGLLRYDPNGQVIDCNEMALRILESDRPSLLKLNTHSPEMNVVDFRGHPMPSSEYPVTRAIEQKRRQLPRLVGFTLPGGKQKWLLDSAVPLLRDEDVISVVAAFSDVTEHITVLNAELMRTNGAPLGTAVVH